MIKTVASDKFKTPPGVIAFAAGLFTAKAVVEGGPKKFGCTLIFSNTIDRTGFINAIKQVGEGAWGDKFEAKQKAGLIKLPFLAGDGPQAHNRTSGKLYEGFGQGKFFIRPQSGEKQPPVVRYTDPNIPADEQEVYSGCIGWAVLHAFSWWHQTGGEGISFGIDMFRKTADGDRLGGGGPVDPEKWWDGDNLGIAAANTNGSIGLFD
jgi:hypothetical protein